MAKPKHKKITIQEVNIQRTGNGYYVYSHDSFDKTPRVFEVNETDGQTTALDRALDYIVELLDTEISTLEK